MAEPSADTFRDLGSCNDVPSSAVAVHYLADRKLRLAITRIDDRLYAFDDLCTCADPPCPLSGGLITGKTLMCQCHGSWFDITTGEVISGPATKPLVTYDAQEIDNQVRVRV